MSGMQNERKPDPREKELQSNFAYSPLRPCQWPKRVYDGAFRFLALRRRTYLSYSRDPYTGPVQQPK